MPPCFDPRISPVDYNTSSLKKMSLFHAGVVSALEVGLLLSVCKELHYSALDSFVYLNDHFACQWLPWSGCPYGSTWKQDFKEQRSENKEETCLQRPPIMDLTCKLMFSTLIVKFYGDLDCISHCWWLLWCFLISECYELWPLRSKGERMMLECITVLDIEPGCSLLGAIMVCNLRLKELWRETPSLLSVLWVCRAVSYVLYMCTCTCIQHVQYGYCTLYM